MRVALFVLAACLASPVAFAQGRRIQARDGDTVVIDGPARVRVVRRADAIVRAIFNPAQRWLVLVVDFVDPVRKTPDGRVEATYTFFELSSGWPFGERWEGRTVIETYDLAGEGPSYGVGLEMTTGLVQILLPDQRRPLGQSVSFQSPSAALVLTYVSFGRGTGGSSTFTEVEERTVANAMRTAELRRTGSPPFDSSLQFTATVPLGTPPPPPDGPRRVGGNIRQPQRIQDAPGILPDVARQAGITGVVILEITIGTDGAVKDARVVRSIPLLDQAALDAARQWKFEVTQLNGVPVPVIMTATVNFR